MSGTKRRAMSIETKLAVIDALEKGEKKVHVAERFDLIYSSVNSIWCSREKIKAATKNNINQEMKRMRKATHEDLDEALLKWFIQQQSLNVPVSGPILKVKADSLAGLLGIENYDCSLGWIERFKKRHSITFGKICGESKSDRGLVSDWLDNQWQGLREKYQKENIFNGDETGLFYQMTPNSVLKFKNEKCLGGEFSKERITVFVCANASGTEKRELLVIGKSIKPRCFKIKNLPVKYTTNKNAWMFSDLFEKEIRNWDNELKKKDRHIVLLLDNCTAHPHIEGLKFIKLVFLPPNTTSAMQPMNQGVIKSLKCNYRKRILLKLVETPEDKISLLDACRTLKKAWEDVSEKTIRNSFLHSGLISDEFEEEDFVPASSWLSSCNIPANAEEFLQFEEDPITTAELTDLEIVSNVSKKEELSDEEDDEEEEDSPPTLTQARHHLQRLTHFFESIGDDDSLLYLDEVEKSLESKFLYLQETNI